MPIIMPKRLPMIGLAAAALLAAALCGCQFPMFAKKDAEPELARNPCIVLALPASGPYAQIAARIKRGASEGAQALAKGGVQIRIENINTESPDWLARLSQLPEQCAIVGGPLRDKAYMEARSSGLLEQRAFFAFVPTLAKGDEGVHAWRFFPSPQDQVDALVDFAADRMSLRSYGALYPSDNYGKRMTETFEAALQKRHMPLQKASYAPGSQTAIQAAARTLVLPKKSENGAIMPQTMFEALFLPDSWKQMDAVTSSLIENGEDRLALLGTTLWEQGLSGRQVPNAEKYALAVFPAAMKSRGGDFWSALGYDFINFGAAVALAMRPSAAWVSERARRAAGAVSRLAPLNWDVNGVAHQRMLLFQVGPNGMAPLDEGRFSQSRTAIAERAALRMQGWGHIDPQTGEALPEAAHSPVQPVSNEPAAPQPAEDMAQTEAAQPASAPLAAPQPAAAPLPSEGVMSSKPRPSYKLSLPARRQ